MDNQSIATEIDATWKKKKNIFYNNSPNDSKCWSKVKREREREMRGTKRKKNWKIRISSALRREKKEAHIFGLCLESWLPNIIYA